MSKEKSDGGATVTCISLLAEKIEAMLHDKGAFREVLPMHLDQPKFRWIVRHDIERVIADHMQANMMLTMEPTIRRSTLST